MQRPGELVELADAKLLNLDAAGPDGGARAGAGGTAVTFAWLQALQKLLDQIGRTEAAATEPYVGGPVRVISARACGEGTSPDGRAVIESLHRELTDGAPEAVHVVTDRADHLSLWVEPAHAEQVAAVVIELLDEVAGR